MKNIINVLETNKYSINIEADYQDKNKINNYYPSYKTLKLLDKFLMMIDKKKEGSVLLSGAYGTGKSYLISILLNILDERFNINNFNSFLMKSNKKYNIENILKKYRNKKYLIIFGDDNGDNYWQSILLGVYRAVKNRNIKLNLSTNYEIIEGKISKWKLNHNETYNLFISKLKEKELEDQFFRFLKEKNEKAINIFSEIYSEIFAGEKFISLEKTSSMKELVCDVEKQAIEVGYDGVIYIFDEFGRYLETGINNIDVKEIQDMAEYCNEDNSSNLFIITHKDVFQYTNKLKSKENLDEWEKVSGRFLKEHLSYEKINVMDILEDILLKKNYEEYRKNNFEEFSRKEILLKETGMLSGEAKECVKRYYPLDYIGANMLPDLSQKLAQNERSLFAYICGNEEKGLKNTILNTTDKFIGLDSLYEYFKDNFKFLSNESSEYKVYINSKNLLNSLKPEEKLERKFIKSLAMIYIYNKFSELEPTPEVMKAILNIENIDKIVNKLKSKNLLGYRKHYNHYKLVEDIDVNVDKEIKDYIENKLGNFDYMETLEENLNREAYYPLEYNDNNNINRYMGRYYLDVSYLSKIDEIMKNETEDGKIIYLTNIEGNVNYQEIKNRLLKKEIVLISNEYGKNLEILDLLKELETIKILFAKDEKYSTEGVLKSELEIFKQEVLEKLTDELNDYFLNGIIDKDLKYNQLNLMDFTTKYLKNKYTKYIGVNYELINKNNLSFPMKKARYDILTKLKNKEILTDESYFNKTTAEGSVARILLKNQNIYKLGQIKLNGSIYYSVYKEVLEDIKLNKINLGDIYRKYTSNLGEYGIRKGIFTFILGLLFIENSEFIGLNLKATQGEIELDLKILDDIEKNPKRYEISYYSMGKEEIEYVKKLSEIFELYIPKNKNTIANRVLAGMKNYIISLPRYMNGIFLRENKMMNKLFSGIFSVNNGREFTLRAIPKVYKEYNLLELIKKMRTDLENLEKCKVNFRNELTNFIICSLGINKSFKELIKMLKTKENLNEIEKYILTLEDYRDEEILIKITERIKGFSYENWRNQKDVEEFKEKFILESKKEGESHKEITRGTINIKYDNKNISVDMRLKETMHGKLLKKKLESAVKNMGQSIPLEEKKKILTEILLGAE